MQDKTNLDKLSEKVSQILQEYNSFKSENETIRNELITLKAQRELQDIEIEKLREDGLNIKLVNYGIAKSLREVLDLEAKMQSSCIKHVDHERAVLKVLERLASGRK